MVSWHSTFQWRGETGRVDVQCVPNDDPDGVGAANSDAFGFPVCTAAVSFPRRSFNAMFGWVQMVRSTDNQSAGARFEMDPFELFGDLRTPYFCYGIEPTLFDAPSRRRRVPVEWLAHTSSPQHPRMNGLTARSAESFPCSASSGDSTSVRILHRPSSCARWPLLRRGTGPLSYRF